MSEGPRLPAGLPEPTWKDEAFGIALYRGDCLDILSTLPDGCVDAVVTDPPYGMNYKPNRNGRELWRSESVYGDDKDFDPMPILSMGCQAILWGANWYADKLPSSGGWLVWDKTTDGVRDGFIYSHCELAWTNVVSRVLKFELNWQGNSRNGEPFLHPTQKSEALMQWCVGMTSGCVLDAYLGSGTTGVACVRLGRAFIGIELEPKYFDIAVSRIRNEIINYQGGPMFAKHEPEGLFE